MNMDINQAAPTEEAPRNSGRYVYLEDKDPVIYVENWVIFRFDDSNWALARHKDSKVARNNIHYFAFLVPLSHRLIEKLIANHKDVSDLKSLVKCVTDMRELVAESLRPALV